MTAEWSCRYSRLNIHLGTNYTGLSCLMFFSRRRMAMYENMEKHEMIDVETIHSLLAMLTWYYIVTDAGCESPETWRATSNSRRFGRSRQYGQENGCFAGTHFLGVWYYNVLYEHWHLNAVEKLNIRMDPERKCYKCIVDEVPASLLFISVFHQILIRSPKYVADVETFNNILRKLRTSQRRRRY